MKDKKGKKGKGFYEEPDPCCIVKGKPVARKHHEVAVKKEAGKALNKPMERKSESEVPEKEELHIVVDPEKFLKLKKYCDENKISFEIDELLDITEGVAVYIITPEAKAECDALLEFIDKNQIAEGVIENKDNNTSSDLAKKIIGKVQERRSESAKAKDNSKTAKNVGDKENAEDLTDWVKNPAKSDLQGVDTKK